MKTKLLRSGKGERTKHSNKIYPVVVSDGVFFLKARNIMNSLNDTIAAIATAPGKGAIAVLRLSGHKSVQIAQSIFQSKINLHALDAGRAVYGKIVSSESNTELIDTVLVTKFVAPHSYTGQDIVEISCHGGPFVTQEILHLLLQNGARAAEPGEFTKRAFINGKLDLLQAESVADIIDAQTRASRRQSQAQLSGVLSERILLLKEQLKKQLVLLEIELDFSEEEIEFADRDLVGQQMSELEFEIDNLLNSFEYGKILREGVHLVLAGKPNVGKSSVLNRLLQEDRAIVSETPGTTRDVIEESLDIKGMLFKISDTAGLRLARDEIESEGVNRTKRILSNADIILFIIDGSKPIDHEDKEALDMIRSISNDKYILLINKNDLPKAEIDAKFEHQFDKVCSISAKTGDGFETLETTLVDSATRDDVESLVAINKVRHRDALLKTREFLQHAQDSLKNNLSPEYVSMDIRAALNSLAELAGEVTTDDILNDIFSSFCVGK